MKFKLAQGASLGFLCAALAVLSGCGKGEDAAPENPTEAAAQLQNVFESAPQEVKQAASTASEAMRQGNYEDAIVSLRTIRGRENITLEQGLALHHSAVAMEAQLIRAMESGDEKAKRAYQILKAFKRD
jgi:hypothetical protein